MPVPASLDDIRALYELRVRREPTYPGARVERGLHTVRLVQGGQAWVSWSDLGGADVDTAIEVEIERFRELGVLDHLEWKLYGSDRPADLLERLVAHGFEAREPADAILVLDLAEVPEILKPRPGYDIRRMNSLEGLDELLSIASTVWPEESREDSRRFIEEAFAADPEGQSLWLAYVDGKPVAEGRVEFACREFGAIWGGATLPEYRNRGIYTALVAARATEAIERACRFLTIDASPMSRGVLEKRGFRLLDTALECNYKGSAAKA
ncbi:MAG TPA: GNAT family N-acetyltransferase [Rectinemataceae bacterium]|nr:GNAT family N-acetyltransferase [Rectinemataceae bacterium]